MKSQVEPPSLGGSTAAALLMGPYKLMDLTAKKGEAGGFGGQGVGFFPHQTAGCGCVVGVFCVAFFLHDK